MNGEHILFSLFTDSSLNDIIFVVNPTFSRDYILHKVNQSKMSRAYDGTLYLPGIVGLNNIKANDYCNVVLQVLPSLMFVVPCIRIKPHQNLKHRIIVAENC